MLAWFLLILLIIQYAMMALGPLLTIYTTQSKVKQGSRALLSFLGFSIGSMLPWLCLKGLNESPLTLLGLTGANTVAIFSWIMAVIGVVIVVWAFRRASTIRKQQRLG